MDKNRLKNIIAEEVDRVLQQGLGLSELSKLNEDYSQRARNFRVALRRRLEKMKPGQVIRYGKLFWTAQGKNNFRDSLRNKTFPNGRMTPGQDVVQALKFAVQSDIMKHRGAAGDDMVKKYLKFEGKLTEAKFYVTYNQGRGMGKRVVTSKESDYEDPRVFKNYNDAEKYVKRAKSGGGTPGRITAYWVSDINMNRIDKRGKIIEGKLTEAPKVAPQTRMEFGVEYRDSKGRPKKDNPLVMRFKTKAQADKYAKRGNKVDKVGGKYTVVQVPIEEKFDSKAQQRYMFATNPKAAKKLASKMTKKDYDELPDKVSKENVAPDHDGKAAPFGSGYKKVKDLEESTKAYEKALQKMARDNKLKMLSKSDKEKLIKIAQMLKKANESVNEGADANRWFSNLKYYYQKGLRSPDLKDPAEKKAYIKLSKQFFSKLKESFEEGKLTEAVDINDPVLVAFRASRKTKPTKAKTKARRISFDKYLSLLDAQADIGQDIKDKAREMAQTLRDMEQEAEPEGGKVADRYGSIMMKQEKEYAKLKAKKAKIDARVEKYKMM